MTATWRTWLAGGAVAVLAAPFGMLAATGPDGTLPAAVLAATYVTGTLMQSWLGAGR